MRCFSLFLSCGLLAVAGACGSKNDDQPQIPYAPVNVVIPLTNQQYTNLRFDNGAVTVPGGVRGIIVVRQNASTYLAFERNCPYRPFDACALVKPNASPALFLRDSCCNSQFDLRGQITGGPASRPLRQYSTSLQGTQLNILN
jgi:hypothetical protein